MAQRRYWNFKDDDSTFDLNFRDLGIIESGRYRGFDPVLGAGLTLQVDHATTGVDKTQLDGTTVVRYGVWNSKQGVVVTEDATIVVGPVAAGDPTDPRIDLIVGQHQYIQTAGGAIATYVILTGTPSPNPVPPALTIPQQQVILGQLFIPAGTTDLNGAGVEYTQAVPPNFAGDETIAHTDRTNNFEELQIIRGVEKYAGEAFLDTAGASTTIELLNATGTAQDNDRNIYLLNSTSSPSGNYGVTGFVNLPTPQPRNYQLLTIYNGQSFGVRFAGASFVRAYYLKPNAAITFAVSSTGAILAFEGDEAALGSINKFYKQNIWNWDTANASTFASGLFTLTSDHNFYNLFFAAPATLRGISSSTSFDASSNSGGMISILPVGSGTLTIEPFDFSVPAGYKPIVTPWLPASPTHPRYTVENTGLLILIEDLFTWRIVDPQQDFVDIPFTLLVNGAGSVTVNGTPTLRVMIKNNSVVVRLHANLTLTGFGATSTIRLQLPIVFSSPYQSASAIVTQTGGLTPYDFVSVTTLSGGFLEFVQSGGFANQAGKILTFTGTFELDI